MGAYHHHHGRRRNDTGPQAGLRRAAVAVIALVALGTVVGLVWLWPPAVEAPSPRPEGGAQWRGQVVDVRTTACGEGMVGDVNGCGTALLRVDEGPQAGDEVEAPLPNGQGAPRVAEGDRVLLLESETPDGTVWAVVDHQRGRGLWVLVVAFALAVVAFGRWRGLSSLAGLVVTFLLLLFFVVPAILAGESPLLVAVVGSAAVVLVVLYLTHGPGTTTTVAVLGTVASLALTGLLSALTVRALHLTGVTDDLSTAVGMGQSVNMQGLLLAGIVIGSVGVLDDVTVTQAATVREVATANPSYGFAQLYAAGARVGRSHIASVINTIVLAYAGSALPLLLLVVGGGNAFGDAVTDQVIAQEIVRSLVATLGLIAAVPITTALAAVALRPEAPAGE